MATDSPASEQTQALIAALYDIAMYGDRGNPKGLHQSIAGTIAGLASAPQAVRMLSSDEIDKLVREAVMAEDSARLLIKRAAYKVLEVNGIVPLAPQDTGGKK